MNVFDPVTFSRTENQFIIDNAGKPPVVALQALPSGVNPRAVRPVIERVYELIELEKHTGEPWAGVEAVRSAAQTYLEQSAKWAQEKRRGRPRFPSLYSYDSKGRAHRYGPGSDSGRIKTYFDQKGNRIKFALELVPNAVIDEWTPEWVQDETAAGDDTPTKGLKVDAEKRRVECELCGHTESFNPESRASFNAARARISKHLRSAKTDQEAHKELHTAEFGA